jgi:hypothetical protein
MPFPPNGCEPQGMCQVNDFENERIAAPGDDRDGRICKRSNDYGTYSCLSAMAGSTCTARKIGTICATTATAKSTPITETNVPGSVALTA